MPMKHNIWTRNWSVYLTTWPPNTNPALTKKKESNQNPNYADFSMEISFNNISINVIKIFRQINNSICSASYKSKFSNLIDPLNK